MLHNIFVSEALSADRQPKIDFRPAVSGHLNDFSVLRYNVVTRAKDDLVFVEQKEMQFEKDEEFNIFSVQPGLVGGKVQPLASVISSKNTVYLYFVPAENLTVDEMRTTGGDLFINFNLKQFYEYLCRYLSADQK